MPIKERAERPALPGHWTAERVGNEVRDNRLSFIRAAWATIERYWVAQHERVECELQWSEDWKDNQLYVRWKAVNLAAVEYDVLLCAIAQRFGVFRL